MKRQVYKCSQDVSPATTSCGKPDSSTLTDKESGFESSPSSPRACSPLEPGHQCLHGHQPELRCSRSTRSGECISLDSFKFIKKLGSGGYGIVVLVEKKRGRDRGALYALKITNLSRAALVEREILPRLHNVPYTTDLAYAFFDPSLPKAFLALPYAIGKDLFSLVGPGRSPGYLRRMFVHAYPCYLYRIRIVLAELSVAIRFLHENNILYRDLKLENILVFGDGHVRLADFGLSRHFEPGESRHISGKTGTPDYMAPEVLRSGGAHGPPTNYSFEADLWSLGVIAYELIVGQLPFKGREVTDLELSILHDPIEIPQSYMEETFNVLLSSEKPMVLAALSFVRSLVRRQPGDRLTNEEIPSHVLFQDLDWSAISSGTHDDPPFDIRRILREAPPDEEIQHIPSVFTGVRSTKRNRREKKVSPSGYDHPVKYRNYHYSSSQFGWYTSSLEGLRCDDSSDALPHLTAAADDDDLDTSADFYGGTPLDEVPGLLAFERAVNDDSFTSTSSSATTVRARSFRSAASPPAGLDVSRVDPDLSAGSAQLSGGGDESFETTSTARREAVIRMSAPRSPDSSYGEGERRPDSADEGAPAPAAPVRHIELFPRVRVFEVDSVPQRSADLDRQPATSARPTTRRPRDNVRASTPFSPRAPPDTPLSPIVSGGWPARSLRPRPAADRPTSELPPRKRRRFLQPAPSSEAPAQAEPADQPLPPFSSLRLRARARPAGPR